MNSMPESTPNESSSKQGPAIDPPLPPVEPPNIRFILQLFIIPAIIVLFVVMVWMLLGWMASRNHEDVGSVVKSLRSSSHSRWQAANELAHRLQLEQRYPTLKGNRELASELALLLGETLQAGNSDENSITMRSFLCRSLGEFRVDEGLAVLLKVVEEDPQLVVRREGLKALAVLGNTLVSSDPPQVFDTESVTRTLIRLSRDPEALIRSETAYAMGAYIQEGIHLPAGAGVPRDLPEEYEIFESLIPRLIQLLEDSHVDTRYNSALALARVGNLAAVNTIAEMLDLDKLTVSMAGEKDPQLQIFKRNLMLRNAMEAVTTLRKLNPQHDWNVLREALDAFLASAQTVSETDGLPKQVLELAKKTRMQL